MERTVSGTYYSFYEDLIVTVRKMGVSKTVVVFSLRTAKKLAPTTATRKEELHGLSQAGLALAVAGLSYRQRRVQLEVGRHRAEGSETAYVNRDDATISHRVRQLSTIVPITSSNSSTDAAVATSSRAHRVARRPQRGSRASTGDKAQPRTHLS